MIGGPLKFTGTPRFEIIGGEDTLGIDNLPFFYFPYGGGHGVAWDNVFIGYRAGASFLDTDTAYANVAVGSLAGEHLHGSDHAPIGDVLIGHGAGRQMVTGNFNTCVGDATGHEIIDTEHNTYVGFHSGLNAKGSLNTFVGSSTYSGLNNLGNRNTCLGYDSFNAPNITAACENNLVVGTESLRGLKTGARNIGLGWGVLNQLVGGSDNIAIGAEAGSGITGSRNIVIGKNVTVSGDDRLNIGGVILGNLVTGLVELAGLKLAGALLSFGANDSGGTGFRQVVVPNA